MKQFLLALVLSLTVINWARAAAPEPYEGSPLPDFSLADLHGKMHKLSGIKGKVVMVNFWATYCPPCLKEMPSIQRLNNKLKGKNFQILALDMGEDRESIQSFIKKARIDATFPILLDNDGEVAEAWNVSALPTTFIIDTHGVIRYKHMGSFEWDKSEIITMVNTLLGK